MTSPWPPGPPSTPKDGFSEIQT